METYHDHHNVSPDQCDVLDQEKLKSYRHYYQLWAKWIGITPEKKIKKNTIWHQCTEMMNNEFTFQALQIAANKAKGHPEFTTFLAANRPLYRYLLDGYFSFQYLAIRRLTDRYNQARDTKKVKGVSSIHRLLNSIKEQSEIITREVFVSFDGIPYVYEQELAKEKKDRLDRIMKGETIWEKQSPAEKSAQRHFIFDQLSGVQPEDRQRTDLITETFWQEQEKLLAGTELESIKNFVDKFLAHAADEDSVNSLENDDKKLSMEKIHLAQQNLTKLVSEITLKFFDVTLAMVPTYGEGELMFNFSNPFLPKEFEKEVYQEIQQQMKDVLEKL